MNPTKAAANYRKGHLLEQRYYDLFVGAFGKENVWINKFIDRPEVFEGKKYHNKKKIEIDLMFYYKRKLYIIQCKIRRGYTKKGLESNFWMPSADSHDIWFNGTKRTGMFLDNLWKAEQYIKAHRIYKANGNPQIVTILLIDSKLKVNKESAPYGMCRGTFISTRIYFPSYICEIQNKHNSTNTNDEVP